MIYVTGDSFCWGDELGDHLLPGFPGYRAQASPQALKDWCHTRHQHRPQDEYRLSHRWSQILADLLGLPVINRALPGKSLHGMLTNISQDLDLVTQAQIVIVQLTGVHRFQIPWIREHQESAWQQQGFLQINPLLADSGIFTLPLLNQFSKLRFQLNQELEFLYDYLSHVLLIQQLTAQSKARLLFVDSVFLTAYGDIRSLIAKAQDHPHLRDLLIKTQFHIEALRFPSMWDILTKNSEICREMPGGHVCAQTHRLFAEEIYRLLREG